ncbi:hypothetical protein PQX77_009306 [Marasmius sp. AFHP31]|nr:hypothetical protein PQX77_009306 [Marasmius sp. AFHP31]
MFNSLTPPATSEEVNGRVVFDADSESNAQGCPFEEELPPYFGEPPEYSLTGYSEPVTFAMFLFKLGFLFPPFWALGASILLSPLHTPEPSGPGVSAWLPEKSDSERQEIIRKIRATELKWARRCCLALIVSSGLCMTILFVMLRYMKD